MNKTRTYTLTAIMIGLSACANAATEWNGGATDHIGTAGNWNPTTLPTNSGNVGTINSDAGWDASAESTLTNFYLDLRGGTLERSTFATAQKISGGVWNFNGGNYLGRTLSIDGGALVTLNSGHISATQNGGDDFRLDDGIFTMTGGSLTASDELVFTTGGVGNFNGGTATFADVRFNGQTLNLGGSNSGSITITTGNFISNGTIAWSTGSLMSFTRTGIADWAETEWNAGRMTVDGDDFNVLGDWSSVNGSVFSYTSGSQTLALIPEPSSIALLGLAGLAVVLFRSRKH
jgi:hypothetical protein